MATLFFRLFMAPSGAAAEKLEKSSVIFVIHHHHHGRHCLVAEGLCFYQIFCFFFFCWIFFGNQRARQPLITQGGAVQRSDDICDTLSFYSTKKNQVHSKLTRAKWRSFICLWQSAPSDDDVIGLLTVASDKKIRWSMIIRRPARPETSAIGARVSASNSAVFIHFAGSGSSEFRKVDKMASHFIHSKWPLLWLDLLRRDIHRLPWLIYIRHGRLQSISVAPHQPNKNV